MLEDHEAAIYYQMPLKLTSVPSSSAMLLSAKQRETDITSVRLSLGFVYFSAEGYRSIPISHILAFSEY